MADETLTMSTRVVGNTDMLESHLNDRELVMMDIDTGSYFGLDNVGKSIWGHLGQPRPVKEICDLVTEEFDVEGNRAAMENDVLAFLNNLLAEKLIHIETDAPSP